MRHLRLFMVTAVMLTIISIGSAMTPAGALGPHDNFGQPFYIFGGSNGRQFTGNTNGYTKQPCEPRHAGNSGGHSIWIQLGSRSHRSFVRMNTAGSSFDTLLAVYRGNSLCGGLRRVVANDDCLGIGSSCVAFTAQRNVSYRIAVDGYNGASGPFRLRFTRQNF
jgi:hypothetical protein